MLRQEKVVVTDEATFDRIGEGLFQPERGLFVVPIRHHSPACSWHLRQLITAVEPARVLIEAPADFTPHIDLVLDDATLPPVALVALVDRAGDGPRIAGYYPFCSHSPEYVALVAGREVGAELSFIDAPAADKTMRSVIEPNQPIVLADESHFDSTDYTAALSRALGCRDGFELWDHLFETQLGGTDWRVFFREVGVYCAGIRAATPDAKIDETGDRNREAHMAHAVAEALAKGGPVVVVVGGFHAPALIGDLSDAPKPDAANGKADAYLVRYGFRALDALNGYAAGLPQPGFYQHLWDRAVNGDDWRSGSVELLSDFVRTMREDGHVIALPEEVEAIRVAESLAAMRGRRGALRHDLIDGVEAALVKGEASGADILTERFRAFLTGDRMGEVPPSAGSPPLVEDVRRRARAHRFDISDSVRRRRKLDIRRKDAHLAASRFLHAMGLLGASFADREIGPDYLSNSRTELLFEEWGYAWSPQVEGQLIECAILGDTLPTACLAQLRRAREELVADGRARDLPDMVTLLSRGVLAGLGDDLAPFLKALEGDIRNFGTFVTVTHTLRRLMFLSRSSGPLGAPDSLDLTRAVGAAYARLVYLADELPRSTEEQVDERLDAVRTVAEILTDCADAGLDRALLDEALDRVTEQTTEPVILGALLSVCVRSGLRGDADLMRAVEGRLAGVNLDIPMRIGVLRGVLHTSPTLLWQVDGLLEAVDEFVTAMPETDFLELLPHLRLAFTALNPRETDRLADMLASLHGVQAGAFLSATEAVTENDLARALRIEKALVDGIETDGLSSWLAVERA